MNRTTDNRDMSEMEKYYLAKIEMLEHHIKTLKEELIERRKTV